MARIRSVKPSFFHHEELFDLETETGLPVRLAFIGLWTCCDREGRFAWRPRSLKSEILPFDDCDFSLALHALATRGFLVKYASNGEDFGYIPSWKKHQFVNNREAASLLPEPTQNEQLDASATRGARIDSASSTRQARVADARGTVVVKEGNNVGNKEAKRRVDHARSPSPDHLLAKRVMDQLGIHGSNLPAALETLIAAESRLAGYDAMKMYDRLIKSWTAYKRAIPSLRFSQKPENFFGGGTWEDPRCWPWKDGMSPSLESASLVQKTYVDPNEIYDYHQRVEEGAA